MKSPCQAEGEHNFNRMIYIVFKVVDKDITQSCPYHNPHYNPDKKVLENVFCELIILILHPFDNKEIDDRERDNIHQSVVTDLELSEVDNIRIDMFR